MKKKLLFVIPGLDAGGAEKSLVNLLNVLDYSSYEVDMLLFTEQGLFLPQIPQEVNLIKLNKEFLTFQKSLPSSIKDYILNGKPKLAFARLKFFLRNRNSENVAVAEQQSWEYISQSIKPLKKKYDAAIAYLEKSSGYLVADFVDAPVKLAWIHTDYSKSRLDPKLDRPFFEKISTLVTISEQCRTSLNNAFPDLNTEIVENISSKKFIQKLSLESIVDDTKKPLEILTIGRISKEKGIDIAVEAAKILMHEGVDFCWNVIGDGPERNAVEKMIEEYGLQDHFKLLGLKPNPYPWLRKAEIYVQPSRYEGRSIAVDEAMLLEKPIIVTDFSTARDQIDDGITGLIVEMNPKELSKKILTLSQNKSQMKTLSDNLKNVSDRSDEILKKFYSLL